MKYIIALVMAGFLVFNLFPDAEADPALVNQFKTYTNSAPDSIKSHKEIIEFIYAQHQYQPIWFNKKNDELVDISDINDTIIALANENGMDGNIYSLTPILKRYDNPNDNAFFDRELALTTAVVDYIYDVNMGTINPSSYDKMIFQPDETLNIQQISYDVLTSRKMEKALKDVGPDNDHYTALKKQLKLYRDIADDNAWEPIEYDSSLVVNPGEYDEIIPMMRNRMKVRDMDGNLPRGIWVDEGQFKNNPLENDTINETLAASKKDMDKNDIDSDLLYDKDLIDRVMEFQYFNGIAVDGVIGPNTLDVLNISVQDRINQIKLAMEHWRWLPNDLGDKYVLANIAGYYAQGYEQGNLELTMPIIVGKTEHETPVFSSVITDVKMHPDWTAPDSISRRYLIDKIRNNPNVIDQLGYELQTDSGEVIPWSEVNIKNLDKIDLDQYRFRQQPGVNNALGLARISIKNDYAIFMHGTPSQSLFNDEDRAFSSGCVRLEDPLAMAYFLLKDEGMSKSEVSDLYHLKENEHPDTTVLPLKKEIPVYLMYNTAWTDEKGHLHFSEDIYNRDEGLKASIGL